MSSGTESKAIPPSRREVIGGAALLAVSPRAVLPVHAQTLLRIANEEELKRALPYLSNWGRWGPDDQSGTLNFITDETRLAAAALIRTGRIVPLGREVSTTTPELRDFSYAMRRYEDPLPEEAGCFDIIGMTCHGFAFTHLDALCHVFTPEGKAGMYNGHAIENVTSQGAMKLGIEHMGVRGIVGRGILLDVADLHGGPLPIGSAIMPEDLEGAERLHGVEACEGDIVFVRNGAGARNTYRRATGLHAACLPWLKERKVAVLSSDSDSDVHPADPNFSLWSEPIHMVGIPYMGLTLLDHAELDALAAACSVENRWSFFVTMAPWRFKGATGSVINPLAMF
jgi:kynurenine formamidase